MKKNEENLRELRDIIKWNDVYIMQVPEKEKRKGQKANFKK